jgi:hypothetical protein
MSKYFLWAVVLVATLGMLGLPLAYPSGVPVSDDEAAQLVGGQTCYVMVNSYCSAYFTGCGLSCWCVQGTTTAGSYPQNQAQCGTRSTCTYQWTNPMKCLPTTTGTAVGR